MGLAVNPVPLDHASRAKRGRHNRARQGRLEQGARFFNRRLVNGYRNAQTTVWRPDGPTHWYGDGLRHHGIEAGLCAGENSKKLRRRRDTFKIITAPCPKRCAPLGYRESDIRTIEAYAVGTDWPRSPTAPAIKQIHLESTRVLPTKLCQGCSGAAEPRSTSILFRLQQMDRWRGFPARYDEIEPERDCRAEFRLLTAVCVLSKRETLRRRNVPFAVAMRLLLGRRALRICKAEPITACSIAPTCARSASAICQVESQNPHDGGVSSPIHLEARSTKNHQHAERRHGGGLQSVFIFVLEARAEGKNALTATARKLSQPAQ